MFLFNALFNALFKPEYGNDTKFNEYIKPAIFLILWIILIICIVSLIIPSVSATVNYSYWQDHYIDANAGTIVSGINPATNLVQIYNDTSFTTRTPTQICVALGMSVGAAQHSMKANNIGGGAPNFYLYDSIAPFTDANKYGVFHGNTKHWWKDNGVTDSGAVSQTDGFGASPVAYCNGAYRNDPTYFMVYHESYTPLTASFTVNTTGGISPLTVLFNDTTITPYDTRLWSFDDGTYSTVKNLTHTFTDNKNYNVTLVVNNYTRNESSTYTQMISVVEGSFYITVSPGYIPADGSQYLYGEIHASPTSLLNNITAVFWTWHRIGVNGTNGQENAYYNVSNSDMSWAFTKTGSNYYGYLLSANDFTYNFGSTMPNPISLNPVGALGSILTTCNIGLNNGSTISLSVSNLIGNTSNSSTNQVLIRVQDAYTGYLIPNAKVSIRIPTLGKWVNTTTPDGLQYINIDVGQHYAVYANASGYQDYQGGYVTAQANDIYYVNMYSSLESTGNMTKLVVRTDQMNTGTEAPLQISNVQIKVENVTNSSDTQYGLSDTTGKYIFYIIPNATYKITASASKYLGVTKLISPGFQNPYDVTLYLTYISNPTPTPTQGYTTYTPTPIPVMTPSTWNNQTAVSCLAVLPPNSTPMDMMKNDMACMGFKDAQSQSLALAGIICLIFMLAGSRFGKALGAAFGGVVGFVLSLALGLIPFWIFVALLILSGAVYAFWALGGK